MPRPILGTMNMGAMGQVKVPDAQSLLSSFAAASCAKTPLGAMVDTARIYQHSFQDGDTESSLGEIFQNLPWPGRLLRSYIYTHILYRLC